MQRELAIALRARVTWVVAALSALLVGHGFVLSVDLFSASSARAPAPSSRAGWTLWPNRARRWGVSVWRWPCSVGRGRASPFARERVPYLWGTLSRRGVIDARDRDERCGGSSCMRPHAGGARRSPHRVPTCGGPSRLPRDHGGVHGRVPACLRHRRSRSFGGCLDAKPRAGGDLRHCPLFDFVGDRCGGRLCRVGMAGRWIGVVDRASAPSVWKRHRSDRRMSVAVDCGLHLVSDGVHRWFVRAKLALKMVLGIAVLSAAPPWPRSAGRRAHDWTEERRASFSPPGAFEKFLPSSRRVSRSRRLTTPARRVGRPEKLALARSDIVIRTPLDAAADVREAGHDDATGGSWCAPGRRSRDALTAAARSRR